MRVTRRALLTAAGGLTTGCLAGPNPANGSPGGSPTDPPATDRPSPTDGPVGITPGVNQPRADHAVYLSNRAAGDRQVQVRVVRKATGETVFEETLTVAPGAEREVYNLAQAEPDGIEAFEVCGQLADPTPERTATSASGSGTPDAPSPACVTIETDACYGSAHLAVRNGGELEAFYSIC